MSDIAVHPATIVSLTQDCAVVEMYVSSACATCEGHDQCGFAEGSVKQVVVPLSSPAVYSVGQAVEVVVSQRMGLWAVVLAYILPSVLILALAVSLHAYVSEAVLALSCLISVGVYAVLLFLFRKRIQHSFHFQLRVPLNQ